ncbi:MAG: hypothetical protein H6782_04410 [Candidatus Nomurabacteria bacterium]|nr:MAG: hypothetical protein H6782_04410 [Candidatus Nomurabacteria bacterium]
MINREHIETILKVNGVAPGSSNEIIRSVLLSARYSKDEADTAIMVLREDIKTRKTRVEGLHKVFRSNEALNSEEISKLLGIDADIDETIALRSQSRELPLVYQFIIWLLSVVVATSGILFYMYLNQMGIFHPVVGFPIKWL